MEVQCASAGAGSDTVKSDKAARAISKRVIGVVPVQKDEPPGLFLKISRSLASRVPSGSQSWPAVATHWLGLFEGGGGDGVSQ